MQDLFIKEINEAIKAVPLGQGWAEKLHKLLKQKRRILRTFK
jgi:hypothetical protein